MIRIIVGSDGEASSVASSVLSSAGVGDGASEVGWAGGAIGDRDINASESYDRNVPGDATGVAVSDARMSVCRECSSPDDCDGSGARTKSSSHAGKVADMGDDASSASVEVAEDNVKTSCVNSAGAEGDSDRVPSRGERSAIR